MDFKEIREPQMNKTFTCFFGTILCLPCHYLNCIMEIIFVGKIMSNYIHKFTMNANNYNIFRANKT